MVFENYCTKCGEESSTVEKRWSFGYYAGRLCRPCCFSFRDHCGIDMPEGVPSELDEFDPFEEEL